MKLACFTVFVCFNYSTGFSNDDFSSFKNSAKEARLLRNDILILELRYQFRSSKIQPKTIDLSMRLCGITTEFVGFIRQSLVLGSIFLG